MALHLGIIFRINDPQKKAQKHHFLYAFPQISIRVDYHCPTKAILSFSAAATALVQKQASGTGHGTPAYSHLGQKEMALLGDVLPVNFTASSWSLPWRALRGSSYWTSCLIYSLLLLWQCSPPLTEATGAHCFMRLGGGINTSSSPQPATPCHATPRHVLPRLAPGHGSDS